MFVIIYSIEMNTHSNWCSWFFSVLLSLLLPPTISNSGYLGLEFLSKMQNCFTNFILFPSPNLCLTTHLSQRKHLTPWKQSGLSYLLIQSPLSYIMVSESIFIYLAFHTPDRWLPLNLECVFPSSFPFKIHSAFFLHRLCSFPIDQDFCCAASGDILCSPGLH